VRIARRCTLSGLIDSNPQEEADTMNRLHQTHPQGKIQFRKGYVLIGLLFGVALSTQAPAAGPDEQYQLGLLFHPSDSQLRAESRGRVMIYDGLDSEDVDRALDRQFERIEHMMFTGTRHKLPVGEGVLVDDDGC
jgi:hypothetical protein